MPSSGRTFSVWPPTVRFCQEPKIDKQHLSTCQYSRGGRRDGGKSGDTAGDTEDTAGVLVGEIIYLCGQD